jgi:short-subunit dehydrogenase
LFPFVSIVVSKGIAEKFAEHGASIAIIGRRKEVLDKAAETLTRKYGIQTLAIQGYVKNREKQQRQQHHRSFLLVM